MKDKKVINNPVAKHAPEFCKPKTFRDRKKDYSRKMKYKDNEMEHPVHQPYERDKEWKKMVEDEGVISLDDVEELDDFEDDYNRYGEE